MESNISIDALRKVVRNIGNDMIKDENTTIKALFFIYELANIIIIYNYYKNLKIKSTDKFEKLDIFGFTPSK